MDADQWAQGIGVVKPMENQGPMIEERKPRPTKPQDLNCPRCHSTHTKFCYYNNYSLSQPRYFCKSCRRYWTEGGSLRNVPVGGGSRKNKRSSSSKHTPHQNLVTSNFSHPYNPNPKITHEGQDLNLAYPPAGNFGNISEFVELSYNENFKSYNHHPNNALSTPSHYLSHMGLLKSGIVSNTIYSSTLPFQDYKPGHNFTLDGFQSEYGGLQGTQENNSARVFFPFEELKPVSTTSELDQNKGNGNGESTTGYWSGGLGGGSSW